MIAICLKLYRGYFLVIATLVLPAKIHAQTYSDMATSLGLDVVVSNNFWGGGVSFFDFDHDGWDDLTYGLDNTIKVYKNVAGDFQLMSYNISLQNNVKQITWIDYDNDGDSDLFVTQYEQDFKLFNNDGNFNFTDVTDAAGLVAPNVRTVGCCWGDYDRDGDPDVYIVTYVFYLLGGQNEYDWSNHLWRNNSDGTFTDVTTDAGVANGIKMSFQPVFTDYDKDLWPDIYIINDKSNPNTLYHNNGDGTFTDVSVDSNTEITMVDAMTNSWADFDGNGYEDVFVTNTESGPCALLANNTDGTFTDVAESVGVGITDFTWGANFFDYDNDMNLDLYISEAAALTPNEANYFFVNDGDGTFTQHNELGFQDDFTNNYANAVGDYNNDGFPEIAVSNYFPDNTTFWVNDAASTNHWIKISVEGVVSNRDGIGTWIECYSGNLMQVKYTYCGEAYLAQNSQHEIFGLAQNTLVDSLILKWPSGYVDHYYNLEADSTYHFVEGDSFSNAITWQGDLTLCPGETVELNAGNYSSYLWSNGEFTPTITVNESGSYSVMVTDEFGFTSTSTDVVVQMEEPIIVESDSQNATCFGTEDGWIQLTTSEEIFSVLWNNGQENLLAENLTSGDYEFVIESLGGCFQSGIIQISEPDSIQLTVETTDVLCFGDSTGYVIVNAVGGNGSFTFDFDGMDSQALPAGDYSVVATDIAGCDASQNFTIDEPSEISWTINEQDGNSANDVTEQLDVSGGTPPYTVQWSNGDDGLTADSLTTGFYAYVITDSNGCIAQDEFEIITDFNRITEVDFSQVNIYPNPCSDQITVLGLAEIDNLVLSNTTGQVVAEMASAKILSLAHLPAGIYALRIESGSGRFNVVVLKE